ncbi:MAG: outer membrane lipoprotein-sorting protein [Deltaproteobacteria bacterium]|jgi:outer membrane lipoprotein-sorting protein|nr:outer membrane lipoprotein-sorting protein [Deltaproteobacteria bacterium]
MPLILPHRSSVAALLALTLLSPAVAWSDAVEIDAAAIAWSDVAEIDARAIALRAENSLRADRTYMRARVTIRSPGRRERAIEFECWNDRAERRSFVRILAPDSEVGVALLNLPPNLWRYEPELARAELIPPSALLKSWLGSDFATGDLIDPFSDVENYEVEVLEIEGSSDGASEAELYVVHYKPLPVARAAWGKIVAWIEAESGAPLRREFYGASGERIRTIQYSDVRSVAGRRVPHRWTAIPAGEKGRQSILEIRDLRFEPAFDDAIFATQNLEPVRDTHPDE